MTITRKKLIYIVLTILLVITATVGTIFALQLLGNNKTDNNSKDATPKSTRSARTEAETKVDKIRDQGAQALQNNELDKARELLQEAKQQYESIGDLENAGDIDAQLAMVDQLSAPPKVVAPAEPGGGQ